MGVKGAMSERANRATLAASEAGALMALGIVVFGLVRLFHADATTALFCVIGGWFLRDAAVDIGRRLRFDAAVSGLAVRDAMLTEVATLPAEIPLSDLTCEGFLRGGYHSYPVVRGEQVVGLLSVDAVLALSPEERRLTSVQATMTGLGAGLVADAGEPLVGALARMARSGVRRLLVVEDGRLSGLLSLSAVFRYVQVRLALLS
jgi:CBS domain-containing protein